MNDIAAAFPLITRLALGLLFAVAAFDKLRRRRDFYAAVLAYRLLPPAWSMNMAVILPWAEAAIAIGLITGLDAASHAAAGLLLIYAMAMAVNLARGRRALDCGCGGAPQLLSIWLVVRNLVLAGAALAPLFLANGTRPLGLADLLIAAGATGALALLYVAGHRLLAHATQAKKVPDLFSRGK